MSSYLSFLISELGTDVDIMIDEGCADQSPRFLGILKHDIAQLQDVMPRQNQGNTNRGSASMAGIQDSRLAGRCRAVNLTSGYFLSEDKDSSILVPQRCLQIQHGAQSRIMLQWRPVTGRWHDGEAIDQRCM